jgi:hypothetical protein
MMAGQIQVPFPVQGAANLIGGHSVNLILVINRFLPHIGRKGEMPHHALKRIVANPRNLRAMDKHIGKNCHDQNKFEDALETFKKGEPFFLAFLPPIIGIDLGDCFALFAHITGEILYS